MRDVDLIALAGLLHDIGKFGQRADTYALREGAYSPFEYKYKHAAYTAQILNDLSFNLGDEHADASAMHHNPQNDLHWIVAAADRMVSGFERETFDTYNAAHDKEDFRKQRLWHLFDEQKRYKIDILSPDTITPIEDNAVANEYDALWQSFVEDMSHIKEKGNSNTDFFTIDYLLKKYTTFIPASTSFQKGGYDAVKANIPLYEHAKATAIFSAALYVLQQESNPNMVDYYRHKPSDIEQEDLLVISGDFFGIQSFIFEGVTPSKASKILRAKSAYVQILTKVIAMHIVEKLGLSYQSIISTHAGKFEILGINDEKTKTALDTIQQELNDFFIHEHFAQTGVGISHTPCSLADFIEPGRYQTKVRKQIAMDVEATKFHKFDLGERNPVLAYDTAIDNQTLCPLCHKRKIEHEKEYCQSCNDLVRLGAELTRKPYMSLSRGNGQIPIFGGYYVNFSDTPNVLGDTVALFDMENDETFRGYAKWELKAYVATNEDDILTFEELAASSVPGGIVEGKREKGVEALIALKGDVDSMGQFIRQSAVTASFARFNFFARMVDYFFSVKASKMMEGRALYTVFAGGDDLFILGAWDDVIAFAKELRAAFMTFAEGSGLTFSVGMVMAKSNKPVNFIAEVAEDALEEAKSMETKDAISLFSQTVKWDDYLDDLGMIEELEILEEQLDDGIPTAFLYRLLDFVTMSKRVKYDRSIKDTMWKSKFAYTIRRNFKEGALHDTLFNTLDEMIEKYPKETRMHLSEFIYKRRIG